MKSWTRSKYLWKFKFFWDDAENAKNDANIFKNIFFWIFNVFRYFWIFLKIYQNMGKKLGSNRCPLFTMFTKQNSSMFCIVSFVKKNLFFYHSISTHLKALLFFFSLFLLFSSSSSSFLSFSFFLYWDPIWRSPFPKPKNVCSSVNLKSHLAICFNQSYMRSHLATSLNQN